ncbi:TfuA-like protein, partial [Streptomyces sp. NPDC059564]|uniref:TfuA-like protein n=1 Tax=Streptomyces sp. NPDC059564 TaxID=3346865 RepID=UPI0036B6C259
MSTQPRTIVTAGPTLTAAEIRHYLPNAEVRPPVAADQVLRWGLRPGDRLLVIDGLFLHSRAVRHKELLALIDQGVEVYGASSMGALRAAELAPFGMVGIGSVFRAYRDQEIIGDDEVALLHADADADHRPLSWALVDFRHAVAHARRTGVLGPRTAELLVATAAEMPFTARDSATILAAAQESGADRRQLDAFRSRYAKGGPRIKRRDALTALRYLALRASAHPEAGTAPVARGNLTYRGAATPLAETVYLRSWRSTPLPDGCGTPDGGRPAEIGGEEVVEAMALSWPGFPAFLREVAAARLLESLGSGLDGTAPGTDWPALSARLSAHLRELGLPAGPGDARRHAALVRPAERRLPWSEAGPLLATRLWRTTSLLDWMTPVVAALEHHPVFAETAAALVRARAEGSVSAADEQRQTEVQCGRLLNAWQIGDADDLLPALRA